MSVRKSIAILGLATLASAFTYEALAWGTATSPGGSGFGGWGSDGLCRYGPPPAELNTSCIVNGTDLCDGNHTDFTGVNTLKTTGLALCGEQAKITGNGTCQGVEYLGGCWKQGTAAFWTVDITYNDVTATEGADGVWTFTQELAPSRTSGTLTHDAAFDASVPEQLRDPVDGIPNLPCDETPCEVVVFLPDFDNRDGTSYTNRTFGLFEAEGTFADLQTLALSVATDPAVNPGILDTRHCHTGVQNAGTSTDYDCFGSPGKTAFNELPQVIQVLFDYKVSSDPNTLSIDPGPGSVVSSAIINEGNQKPVTNIVCESILLNGEAAPRDTDGDGVPDKCQVKETNGDQLKDFWFQALESEIWDTLPSDVKNTLGAEVEIRVEGRFADSVGGGRFVGTDSATLNP